MKWFVYSNGVGQDYLFVQAKTNTASEKRLTRWSKLRRVNITNARQVEGKGYGSMTEASMTYPKFSFIDGSI